ncbi:MAG: hemerythrin domain-containing protein [Proteobacteria bacterium]|nr:hemerythrin domain-containing protein [Pseudomonadota bacterium]MBU1596594.1 hemerythrin domain-containing protein [Pseudomonadota bacterium]
MDCPQWSEDDSVGIAAIDRQHRHLFNLANEFDSHYSDSLGFRNGPEGESRLNLHILLTNLRRYFLAHFSMEEELQIRRRYKNFIEHKNEHDKFITGHLLVAKELHAFLLDWTVQHTTETDIQYAPAVAQSFDEDGKPRQGLTSVDDAFPAFPRWLSTGGPAPTGLDLCWRFLYSLVSLHTSSHRQPSEGP